MARRWLGERRTEFGEHAEDELEAVDAVAVAVDGGDQLHVELLAEQLVLPAQQLAVAEHLARHLEERTCRL